MAIFIMLNTFHFQSHMDLPGLLIICKVHNWVAKTPITNSQACEGFPHHIIISVGILSIEKECSWEKKNGPNRCCLKVFLKRVETVTQPQTGNHKGP